jgi:dTDP-4-amino-4,6-dideoxygalactose transaminase
MVACWYDQTIWDVWKMPKHDVVWVYDLRIPGITGTTQNALVSALQREGIQARHAFKPLSKQEEYSGSPIRLYHSKRYVTESNSDIYSREVIYLPAHPSVTVSQVNRAAEIIEIVICGGA